MSALSASVAADRRWTPAITPERYDRRPRLSDEERLALEAIVPSRYRWPAGAADAVERLTTPIDDVLTHVAPQAVWWGRSPTRAAVLRAMHERKQAFWAWGRDEWVEVLRGTDPDVRQLVGAVGYLLCGQRDVHREFRGWKTGKFVRRVFGGEPVEESLGRVQGYLDGLGHATMLQRPNLQGALHDLMLLAGTPLLDDLAGSGELLARLRSTERNNARRYGVEQLGRTLVDMGVLASLPFGYAPTREEWLARSQAGGHGVPAVWLEWAQRWFVTSTLSRVARQRGYYAVLRAGRWLAAEHPDHADPRSWTRELAAAWVAAVDQMQVGEFAYAPNTAAFRERRGGPLSPRTKAQNIGWLGAYFRDLQEWEWIERRFDPRRAFAVPRSILALIGPDPRVISDDVWAKLLWAGLNLTEQDLPRHGARETGPPWYPLELVRAVALLWLFGGLRNDEIVRLRLGAIRWQEHATGEPKGQAVCLLDVPVNKTATAFTKPVDRTVGEAILAWETARPAQPELLDRKTGELVQLLFAYRGQPIGRGYVNRVLIPMLCGKAGVPREDVRGPITSHRARATIASQLYNAKQPMTLFELQAWLGHRWVGSTQHYAQITPTKLAAAYTQAGYFARNVRAIEVLLDRDAIHTGAAGNGNPFEYYDLGHGYCTYTFFEQCPHRMACARCDFYLPKPSSEAQLLEAKNGMQRMLVEIPLTDNERAAVEGDQDAVGRLIDLLADVATPAGRTPRELNGHPTASSQPADTSARVEEA